MPDAVKISELETRSANSTDFLPAIDSTFSQTVRISAGTIAAIGGGPPGDGTVTTAKLVNNAVTYAKIQNVSATDKILGRASSGSGVVEEIACTSVGRGLLACATAAAARVFLDGMQSLASPVFTGQLKTDAGTSAAPAYSTTLDGDTGVFFPDENTVGIATEGKLRWQIDSEGTTWSAILGQSSGEPDYTPIMRPQYAVRAWAFFNGNTSGSTTINSQATIAARYGKTNSLYLDGTITAGVASGATVTKIKDLENSLYSNTLSLVSATAADGRKNYTTQGDNTHWAWNATTGAWYRVAATGRFWIGSITFSSNTNYPLLASGGVTSVVQITGAGRYQVNFLNTMPDTNYAVVFGSSTAEAVGSRGSTYDTVTSRNVAYCQIAHVDSAAYANPTTMSVAVFR
jgi:hypothetical protein